VYNLNLVTVRIQFPRFSIPVDMQDTGSFPIMAWKLFASMLIHGTYLRRWNPDHWHRAGAGRSIWMLWLSSNALMSPHRVASSRLVRRPDSLQVPCCTYYTKYACWATRDRAWYVASYEACVFRRRWTEIVLFDDLEDSGCRVCRRRGTAD
jgi:hypothetical protein